MSKSGPVVRVRLLIRALGVGELARRVAVATSAAAPCWGTVSQQEPMHGPQRGGVSLPLSSLGLPPRQPEGRVAAPAAPSARPQGLPAQPAGEAGHTAPGGPGMSGP